MHLNENDADDDDDDNFRKKQVKKWATFGKVNLRQRQSKKLLQTWGKHPLYLSKGPKILD